ncbi:hypothetical protein ADK67_40270 [Saccharothrix sp. NRRL B-16348]|uniref:hypothetical protein n=1 Tax=Saccharothrix sp. NRRL B-16348 TaxID=1415542 RepID=UPI0006AFE7E5|nr:hypothetical protein [Saccharothrix sp. NRRL B-16348]KOX16191.1 hypothetical protein ADK67_40270 [Saccharothrix sp. NRRL B-16348]
MTTDPWGSPQQPTGSESSAFGDVINDPFADTDTRYNAMADLALGHAVMLLVQRGERAAAELVLDVDKTIAQYDERYQDWDFWLEVTSAQRSRFEGPLLDKLREAYVEVCQRLQYPEFNLMVREIMPEVGPGWREQLREQLTSPRRPTNQGRQVRLQPPKFREDYLAFTNQGEQTVYQALRQIQEKDLPRESTIGIYPLAGGRVPGRTWEPDFLVTYKGRAGVLEIDGPHHNGRRAMDTTRDHLLMDAGIAFVDRIPVEAVDDPSELNAVLRRFLRRLGDAS